jgi:hypothetical protein
MLESTPEEGSEHALIPNPGLPRLPCQLLPLSAALYSSKLQLVRQQRRALYNKQQPKAISAVLCSAVSARHLCHPPS